ncbi:MAG: DNA polymerase III subunit delta [Candidatus Carbobacillus altaicus]|nr:DNA polymerase III subunit delta [Candidatus Carbobacillus altaicus]
MAKVQQTVGHDKVLVIYGEEAYLRHKWIHDTVEAWRSQWEQIGYDVAVWRYDLSVSDFAEIGDQISSLSLFSSHEIIIVDNALFLTSQVKGAERARQAFQDLLQSGAMDGETVRLILHVPEARLDARTTVYKLLQKHARLLEAKSLKGKERERWIREELSSRRLELLPTDLEALFYMLPQDLSSIAHTLDVLALYAEQGGIKRLSRDDLDALVPPTFSATVFKLIDLALQGKAQETFLTLADLMRQGEEPIKLLSILTRQIRQLALIIALSEQGKDSKTIAQTLGVHFFVVQKGQALVGKWSVASLRRLFSLATSLDVAIKSGEMDKGKALEYMLLAMVYRNIPQKIF